MFGFLESARKQPSPWSRAPEAYIALWGGALHLAWEFLQSPLYADWSRGWFWLTWTRLHCTAGDIVIMLVAYWILSIILSSRRWLYERGCPSVAAYVAICVGYTIYSEWFNTQVQDAWQYATLMPTVFGIGLTPLLQWIIIPPCVLRLARGSLGNDVENASADT